MIYHPKIRFRERSNYDERLVVSTFEPDSGETDSYLTMEPVYTDSYDGAIRTDYGAKYSDVARPSVTLIDVDGEDIIPSKVRSVLRWLTGSRQNSWMDVYNVDDEIVCSYLGRFTDVKLQKMDSRVIGIRAEFTSVSPWAYSEVKEVKMEIDGETDFSIDNDSDDLYSCVYPQMIFMNNQNGAELSVKNNTIGEETKFSGLQKNEIVTIDNNFVVYSNNKSRIFNNDFNFIFPSLSSGTNSFEVNGNGTLTMKFRCPMKVSDGLLNEHEIRNSVIIYVEGTTVKIKGDTNKNPPSGVNIKVDGTTMFIRGELKGVSKVSSENSVFSDSNGTLTIDDSNNVCPFDEFNAEVRNGVLIIKKDFKDADIKE